MDFRIFEYATKIIQYYRKRKIRKIPLGVFIKKIEGKIRVKLSKQSKEDIINRLYSDGIIQVVTSRNGKRYIITGQLI